MTAWQRRSQDPEEYVTVAEFIEPVNAQMAKGALESAGIECFLQGEHANSLMARRSGRSCRCIGRTKRPRARSSTHPMPSESASDTTDYQDDPR